MIAPESGGLAAQRIVLTPRQRCALLLGKRTYEIFASYWPAHERDWPGINAATKYVVSDTRTESLWDNTVFINDNVVDEIRRLKQSDGPDLQVYGSSQLLQTLFKNDLADELWLKIFPIILGTGKRLFGEGVIWKASSHRHAACTSCHYEPGMLNHLKGKWVDGQVSLAYFLSGKRPSKPHAEISDAACLQKGCHTIEGLQKDMVYKNVTFSHGQHLRTEKGDEASLYFLPCPARSGCPSHSP